MRQASSMQRLQSRSTCQRDQPECGYQLVMKLSLVSSEIISADRAVSFYTKDAVLITKIELSHQNMDWHEVEMEPFETVRPSDNRYGSPRPAYRNANSGGI